MNCADRISVQPELMGGEPCVKGTRIPVSLVLGSIADGDQVEELLRTYPQLTDEDVVACIEYEAEKLKVSN